MKEYQIVKIEKGCFMIQYKTKGTWGDWKIIDKKFKSITKAKDFINKKQAVCG